MIERSLVLLKPDAVARGIVGEILVRFERAGLKMVGTKLTHASDDLAELHYPTTKAWLEKVGGNTLHDCEKYGIDVMKTFGSADAVEIGKMVKKWNKDFLTKGPILAIVLEGTHAIERIRSLVGPTVPVLAPAGTIRGDFSLDSAVSANKAGRSIYNLIHASGTVEEAQEEIKLWFKPEELLNYRRVHEDFYSY